MVLNSAMSKGVGVRRCTRLVHRATVLLRVSTVVAFCAALIGGGAVGAKAEITASVPAGVHWRASPEGMPLWGPNRFWPGSGLVLRRLGPGFTVLALGPGFRPIFIHSFNSYNNERTRGWSEKHVSTDDEHARLKAKAPNSKREKERKGKENVRRV